MREHPGVHVANEKELNYFSELYDKMPDGWYEGNFIPHEDQLFTEKFIAGVTPIGEASPTYCFHPEAMYRIWQYNPNMKLIMLLRDPVRRAISHYWWEVRMQNEKRPIQEALLYDDVPEENISRRYIIGYREWGRYHEQLARINEFFPPNRLLILTLEHLRQAPLEFMSYVTDFIGVPEWDGYSFEQYLKTEYSAIPHEIITRLRAYFAPHNEKLRQIYGVDTRLWES